VGWFQTARDSTAFVVSLASLVTSLLALRNTLTGPRPILGELAGETITIVRSSEVRAGTPPQLIVTPQDESLQFTDFPLLLVQPAVSNRAAPPNGTSLRWVRGALAVTQGEAEVYRADYAWFRMLESDSFLSPEGQAVMRFGGVAQVGPFDLPAGGTWSRELLRVPTETRAARAWPAFLAALEAACAPPARPCRGALTLRVRVGSEETAETRCDFEIGLPQLTNLRGERRRFFTTPGCAAGEGGATAASGLGSLFR
jgi:hypothetical protein